MKPDAVIRRGIGAKVIQEFLNNKEFTIDYSGEICPSREFIATEHYAQHKETFFYEWLLEYVTLCPLLVFILRGVDIIYKVRTLLGATLPEEADNNTIRGKHGILGGINVAHASDSVDNGHQEVDMWRDIIKIQDCDHMQEATEYMKKYIDFPAIDTKEYRTISNLLIEDKIARAKAKKLLTGLLQKESDINDNTISQFATVIIKNALLRKERGVRK